MFTYAAETLELIPKSPVKKGLAPKIDKHEKPALSQEQAWLLWDRLKDAYLIRYRAFYGVLLFTSIRTGEALGLKWEGLDFANRQLTIKRAVARGRETTPKTKASLRTRPVPPELYTALVNHKAMAHYAGATDYVFASSSGRPMNPDLLRETLQSVLRDKLKITLGSREDGLHLLRHTSGSLVFEKTGSVKEAQTALGHSSARITMDTTCICSPSPKKLQWMRYSLVQRFPHQQGRTTNRGRSASIGASKALTSAPEFASD